MSYEKELCKYYKKAKHAVEKPKEFIVPASARTVLSYRDPLRNMGDDLVVEVRATKARWFVWRFGAWAVRTEDEARAVIEWATEEKDRRLAQMARMWKVKDYVDHCRSVRNKRKAKADREELLASIEEAALRMTLKAKTLEERMAINDEKEQLEEKIYDAYSNLDFEDEDVDFTIYEAPELPEAWRIIAAKPTNLQYNLKI